MGGFFKKVTDGISKGVDVVGANSKAMAAKSKVKGNISSLEGEGRQLMQLLGQKIFAMYQQTGEISIDEGVANFLKEIQGRADLIAQQQEELVRIDDELAAATAATAASNINPNQNQQPTGVCTCGHNNHQGAKFCSGCGAQLN